ncbi:MAG: threonine dehydratase [Nitrospinota bacterium]
MGPTGRPNLRRTFIKSLPVQFEEILTTRETLYRHLPRTPTYGYPGLSEILGCEVFIKHENHLPTGAFKVRGGVYLMSRLPEETKRRGVVCATRGNHGLSVAYASRLFGVRAVICVPEGNNPEKNKGMRDLGAELVIAGKDYDEARERAAELVQTRGLTEIHAANSPDLIRGVGTYALEIFEDVEDVDAVIVPVGLGSGACGVALVAHHASPHTSVIGVQAECAPSVYLSWKGKEVVETETADTVADDLATRKPAELTLGILRALVREMVLVSEDEIRDAIRLLIRETHNLAEGAGAAALAAARKRGGVLAGKRVVVVLSGGNIDARTLRGVLQTGE